MLINDQHLQLFPCRHMSGADLVSGFRSRCAIWAFCSKMPWTIPPAQVCLRPSRHKRDGLCVGALTVLVTPLLVSVLVASLFPQRSCSSALSPRTQTRPSPSPTWPCSSAAPSSLPLCLPLLCSASFPAVFCFLYTSDLSGAWCEGCLRGGDRGCDLAKYRLTHIAPALRHDPFPRHAHVIW